eukprot:8798609-Pyramimonas_sp.AAC.1
MGSGGGRQGIRTGSGGVQEGVGRGSGGDRQGRRSVLYKGGWCGQVRTPKGPQHRLQTANQGVQCIKGVHSLPSDYRLPTTSKWSRFQEARLRVFQAGLVPRTRPCCTRVGVHSQRAIAARGN